MQMWRTPPSGGLICFVFIFLGIFLTFLKRSFSLPSLLPRALFFVCSSCLCLVLRAHCRSLFNARVRCSTLVIVCVLTCSVLVIICFSVLNVRLHSCAHMLNVHVFVSRCSLFVCSWSMLVSCLCTTVFGVRALNACVLVFGACVLGVRCLRVRMLGAWSSMFACSMLVLFVCSVFRCSRARA